jgi:uncharacterized RDD family membrane protein YckC
MVTAMAMASDRVGTAGRGQYQYVGFWLRFGASLIDTLITTPVAVGAGYLVTMIPGSAGLATDATNFVFNFVAIPCYFILFWIWYQATPGKMALGMRIVDAKTGRPASTGQLVGRYFAYILSSLPLCAGFLWVAFDERKQGWHDKLAGTVVVKGG